jgi:putative nucleotidyltransferase with HDIG domain
MSIATAPVQDNKQLIASALAGVSNIATLPEVTAKIVKTVEDPKSNAQQLHKIVSHDPALVARILKVVNSSFYGLPGQIASIERAIVMLGLNAVKNIAVAASIGQLFRATKLCEGFTAKDLWSHCVGVAIVARELARQSKLAIADEAFLAGMIHDIGLLVSLQVWPEKLKRACEEAMKTGQSLTAVERTMMGVDHQQLGAALAEKWQFPRSCQLVAGFHHDSTWIPAGAQGLVSLIALADQLCVDGNVGFHLTRLHGEPTGGLREASSVTPAAMENVQARLGELLSSGAVLLG